jgi:hypothetical protein
MWFLQVPTKRWAFHIRIEEDFDAKVKDDADAFVFSMRNQLAKLFGTTHWNVIEVEAASGSVLVTGDLAAYNANEEKQLAESFADVDDSFKKGEIKLVSS